MRIGILVLVALAAAVSISACGDEKSKNAGDEVISFQGKEANTQTISFQEPEEPGPDPFTDAVDVKGDEEVELPVGQGPYGGTGSDRVCDRNLLIRSLKARPDRMREWARVLGLKPTFKTVSRYIARLHPVTLTRDTQVTNHSFVNGRAVAFQAILAAGTAVLVDKYGRPVVRCRCGNPLLEPVYVKTARCVGCPPDYRPPKACDLFGRRRNYDRTYYRRDYYPNGDFDEVFIRSHRRAGLDDCYVAYPDPPVVTIVDAYPEPRSQPPPAAVTTSPTQEPPHTTTNAPDADNGPPRASFSPSAGGPEDTYTLYVAGFRPGITLELSLIRPDGVVETYSIGTGGDGSGSLTFPHVQNPISGTYTASVRDPATGNHARASVTVSG